MAEKEQRFFNQNFTGYTTLRGDWTEYEFSAGNYYVLGTEGAKTLISSSPEGGSIIYVENSVLESKSHKGYEYINLASPADGYQNIVAADRMNSSEATKLKAGSYYLIQQAGNYAQIAMNPDGLDALWISMRSDGTVSTDPLTAAGGAEQNVDPSNTGTVSGYQNPASATVYKKNPKMIHYPGEHFNSYIKNMLTKNVVEFDLPRGVSENMQADFETTIIRGRSMPFHGYSNTGDRSISITIPFHADLCKEDFSVTMDKLRALDYPSYENDVGHPLCLVRLGNFFCDLCIVMSISITYPDDGAIRNGEYTYSEVSLEFMWSPQSVPSASDVEKGAGKEITAYAGR